MNIQNKKGAGVVSTVFIALIFIFVILIGVVGVYNYSHGISGPQSIVDSAKTVSSTTTDILSPLFGFILNFGGDSNNNALMLLAFILVLIIIAGTLDSISIFGEDTQGKFINFAIGFIVSVIGIRFMPSDIWGSLAAPSSAFVATLLVGVPFFALAMVTIKMNNSFVGKLIWLFYLVFLGVVLYTQETNQLSYIYLIFFLLALVMLFLDSTVRRFVYREKHKKDIEDTIGQLNAQKRYNLRRNIEAWQNIIADTTASASEIANAKQELAKAQKRYGDISAI